MKYIKKVVAMFMVLMTIITILPLTAYATESNRAEGITRAEWLSKLAKIFEMTVTDDNYPDNYFADLSEDSEYYYDVLLAVQFGVVDIEAGENIYPDAPVTREFASHTLNYCLGYQAKENETYSFSDVDECTYPLDAQIAVERGWLELKNGKFSPLTELTSFEVEKMIEDAKQTLQDNVIDENHENSYEVAENIIEVPYGTLVDKLDDATLTITNSPVTIQDGDFLWCIMNL